MGWGSLFGALGLQADQQQAALSRATDKQTNSLNYATDIGNKQFEQTRQDNMPALNARNWALEELQKRLGGTTKIDATQEPGYQFGLDQGLKAVNNQFGARGMRNSGAAIKAGTRYAQDYATSHYGDAFNRSVNPLLSLAGAGQAGAGTIASAGQANAQQAGQNAIQIGNVGAAKSMGTANIWSNALNQGIGMMMGGM